MEQIKNECQRRIAKLPNGVEKAEAWLTAAAKDAGASSDLEAAIYLASRGRDVVSGEVIRERWHSKLCSDIAEGKPIGEVAPEIRAKADNLTLSLAEAEQVLRFRDYDLPSFFSFPSAEGMLIDATMFRAVEWFQIGGFESWLDSYLAELSAGPQGASDERYLAFSLFYWCRSDLALERADRAGLDAWLLTLINSGHLRNKPWNTYWYDGKKHDYRDHLPIAAAVAFAWERIKPGFERTDIKRAAVQLIMKSQLASGAWPLLANDTEPCLMSTYMAIHALAMSKPTGWQAAARRAATWLSSEQQSWGGWNVSGGSSVVISVLVLDAIALANESTQLTFGRTVSKERLSRKTIPVDEYEKILELLRAASIEMERHPAAFVNFGEEDIRDALLVMLNSHYPGKVTGETFNAGGKTDILVRVQNRNTFIAECKVWGGIKEFRGAIAQLMRYLTWRDCKCAILVFNRDRNPATVNAKMHEAMQCHAALQETVSHDSDGGRYVLTKPTRGGQEIIVSTMIFDLPHVRASRGLRVRRIPKTQKAAFRPSEKFPAKTKRKR